MKSPSPHLLRNIDLTFCFIILPAMIAIFPAERWAQNFPLYSIPVVVWLYLLYFCNRKFIVPRLIKKEGKDYLSWILILLSFVITIILASVNLFQREYSEFDDGLFTFLPRLKMYQQAVICWFMVVESFSFVIGLIADSFKPRTAC